MALSNLHSYIVPLLERRKPKLISIAGRGVEDLRVMRVDQSVADCSGSSVDLRQFIEQSV